LTAGQGRLLFREPARQLLSLLISRSSSLIMPLRRANQQEQIMFAIVNATIDPVTRAKINRGTVLVKNGKIAAVGKNVSIPARAERIDAKNRLVTPGFIDAHTHAGLAADGLPGDSDINETTDPVTPQIRAIDAFRPNDAALLEGAQSGVTAVFITPGSANVIGGLGAVVKTVAPSMEEHIVKLDAGLKMAMGENPKRVYGEQKRTPSTRMGAAAVMREALSSTKTYIQKKRAHARKKRKTEPFETDLRKEVLVNLLRGKYPARCHAHRSIDMLTAIRIADEFKFKLVFEHATECQDILRELSVRKIPVVIGPTFTSRTKVELQHKNFASVREAVAAGLTVAITADTSVTPLRYLNVYAALAIREGLDPSEALRAVTVNPAVICGVADRIGSIQRGKDADLILWEDDPFDVRSKPERVWIDGREIDMSMRAFTRWWPAG